MQQPAILQDNSVKEGTANEGTAHEGIVQPTSHAGCIRYIAGIEAMLGSKGLADRQAWEEKISREWSEDTIRSRCAHYHICYVAPLNLLRRVLRSLKARLTKPPEAD